MRWFWASFNFSSIQGFNYYIHINTILHHHRPPEAERVLKAIAKAHGGTYRFVSEDDE